MKWKSVSFWLHGLFGGFIGGGASAVTAFMGMSLAKVAGMDVPTLNWKAVGIIFLTSGLASAAAYLKQSPLPPDDDAPIAQSMGVKLGLIFFLAIALSGCTTRKLETGGAYAPTNSQPDVVFYTADASFGVAESVMLAAFKFERDNRAMLWKIDPNIKHTLDKIRPNSVLAIQSYLAARKAYQTNPIPLNATFLQTALGKVQSVSSAAAAAVQVTITQK